MTKYFTAINKDTGEEFKSSKEEFLVMFDTGFLGVVKNSDFYGTVVMPLPNNYRAVFKQSMIGKIERNIKENSK